MSEFESQNPEPPVPLPPAGTMARRGTEPSPRTPRGVRVRRRAASGVRLRIRVLSGSVCIALGMLGLFVGTGSVQAAAAGSAVTKNGTGAFANLKITVSQTQSLVDQAVTISWTGAAPTIYNGTNFAADYLQIMQCWGDDPAKGPDRTQCQFGVGADQRGGSKTFNRQVAYNPPYNDNAETITTALPPAFTPEVPFAAVDGQTVAGDDRKKYFDAGSTNEIPYAPTAADGTGQVDFEVETALEASALGCGSAVKDAQGQISSKPCWLVVVPRDTFEVSNNRQDPYTFNPEHMLMSSPLSQTNWDQRVVFQLGFVPLADPCPFGQASRPILGSEQNSEAMRHWQPALCTANPVTFAYVVNPDDQARTVLTSQNPGLDLMSRGVPAAQAMPNGPPVYAPVALSGLTVAFNVDKQVASYLPNADQALDGTPVTQLNLTPRLVAKLLTESYRLGVSNLAPEMQAGGALQNNPSDLTQDPDFLAANPTLKAEGSLYGVRIPDIVVPLNPSDAAYQLWTWINADPDARAFLDGTPDPYGMVVNPAYKKMALPVSDFPKLDPFKYTPAPVLNTQPTDLGVQDLHPWATTMHTAARGAARGDDLAKTAWSPVPPLGYGSDPAQQVGHRAILAITDTATAERYGLRTAALRNTSGVFVAPDQAGLTASAATAIPVDGVPVPDPASKAVGAYPLTVITYAATVPALLSAAEGADYATFLDYVANGGQTPGVGAGQLPPGYVPLTQAMHDQAVAAAARIKSQAGVTPTATSQTTTASSGGPAGGTSSGASGSTSVGPDDGAAPGSTLTGPGQAIGVVVPGGADGGRSGGLSGGAVGGPASPAPSGKVITPTPRPAAATEASAGIRTPLTRLGAVRFTLLVLLIAGGVLILAGPALRGWAATIPRRATPPGVHLE